MRVCIAADADEDAESKVERGCPTRCGRGSVERLGEKQTTANELLESPTNRALRIAVRLFHNTEHTDALWTVIENSPHQQLALDLVIARFKDAGLVPDYNLPVSLTGMKARLDKPME